MTLQGKLLQALPVEKGVTNQGTEWMRQRFIVETMEQYPKTICFEMSGENRLQGVTAQPTDIVKVDFEISSREYQGRWYTQCNAWRIHKAGTFTD